MAIFSCVLSLAWQVLLGHCHQRSWYYTLPIASKREGPCVLFQPGLLAVAQGHWGQNFLLVHSGR